MKVNCEAENMWTGVVVTYFKALFRDLPTAGVSNLSWKGVTSITVGRFAGRTCKNHKLYT